jgi:hypothetical protein
MLGVPTRKPERPNILKPVLKPVSIAANGEVENLEEIWAEN